MMHKRCCIFSLHMVYYVWKLGGDYMTMLEGFKPFNFSEGVALLQWFLD